MNTTVPQTDLATVTIDGVEVRVPKGTLLVEAAKLVKNEIPVYCYHSKLGPAGLCRVCLVDIEGMPKLQIACNTPVTDGMKVTTQNEKASEGRRAILEFLLLNHPLDCPICDKGGECDLQDYSMAYGQGASRMIEPKDAKPKAVDLGPTIVLDEERCILCLRCVRFDDIITREQSLRTEDRGVHAIIATATGDPYVSDFSGNVTEICPVGALTSKTYRFKSRPWDNHRTDTTCMQCSVGCQMHVDERANTILRTMSVEEDDQISDGWLCDRGRYNVGYLTDDRRITQPLYKQNGSWSQIGWDDAIAVWASAIKEALASHGPQAIGAIGGGRLLNEEAFLLAHVHRKLGIENLDWRAGRQVRAHPGPLSGTHIDLENADVIVTYGRPPAQLAPILDLRIRKAVSRMGATLLSIGDHRASGVVRDQHVATVTDAEAALPAAAQRIALIWDGTETSDALAFLALADALRERGKTVHFFISGEQPNARGAESLGMLPQGAGRETRAMLEAARDGQLAVLSIFAANPLLHYPDRALAQAALDALPFVVVSDLFMTDTAAAANLILPACSVFEKSGTMTDLTGDVLPVLGSVVAPGEAQADGDMLMLLAEALGVPLPGPIELERSIASASASAPRDGRAWPAGSTVIRPVPPVDGALRLIVESSIFSGGGSLAFDPRLTELRTQPRARLHPQTAVALGIAPGDLVDVIATNGGGEIGGLVAGHSEHVPVGAVAIVDGLPAAPANALDPSGGVQLRLARVAAGVGI
jgi:NADH-quinone oxidoreductase subunit G